MHSRLKQYEKQNGHLPFATSSNPSLPPLSWRVATYFPNKRMVEYDQSKDWDAPSNLRSSNRHSHAFAYEPSGRQRDGLTGFDKTYFKAIIGPDTAFCPSINVRLNQLPNDLVLVVRVEQSSTHWMEPGDLEVGEMTMLYSRDLLLGENGYALLFADGKSWWLSKDTPYENICKFFTITNAENYDRDQLLKPYKLEWAIK